MAKTVSDTIVALLEDAKVNYVFGVSGETMFPLLSSITQSKRLSYIPALNENAAIGMADGYSRASDKVGVALVHTTPGLTMGMANLCNAFQDDSSLIAIVGDVNSKSLITEPSLAQRGLIEIAKAVTKWSYYAASASDAVRAFERALNIVHSSQRGPCCLIIPEDIQSEDFSGEDSAMRIGLGGRTEVAPDAKTVQEIARMVKAASWPIVFVGKQVRSDAAVNALSRFCLNLGIPVLLESQYPPRGVPTWAAFPQNHPCYMGVFPPQSDVMRDCDLVIAFGGQPTTGRESSGVNPFGNSAKFVHIHSNPWELGKNLTTDLGVVASPNEAAVALEKLLTAEKEESESGVAARLERLKELRQKADETRSRMTANSGSRGGSTVKPWDLVIQLKKALKGKDYVIVDEGVTASAYLWSLFGFDQAGSMIGRSAGAMGWGLSAAVGAKLGLPEKRVVAFVGDGALLFCPQALWTAAHSKIPLAVVVCNNQRYGSQALGLKNYNEKLKRPPHLEAVEISNPAIDIASFCAALGGRCTTVTRGQDLPKALRSAISSESGVNVVDVHIDPKEILSSR